MRTRVLVTVFPVKTRLWKDKLFIYLVFFVVLFLVAGLGDCFDGDALVGYQLTFILTFRLSPDLQFLSFLTVEHLSWERPVTCLVCVLSGLICVQYCRCDQRTNSCNVEHVHECSWMLKFYKIFHQKSAKWRKCLFEQFSIWKSCFLPSLFLFV